MSTSTSAPPSTATPPPSATSPSTDTSTPNAIPPPGQCVVCGKETKTRCSSCLKAGMDGVYFCSQAHQKLVWFLHKRVCSKPQFRWPLLSVREVTRIEDIYNKPWKNWKNKDGDTGPVIETLGDLVAREFPPEIDLSRLRLAIDVRGFFFYGVLANITEGMEDSRVSPESASNQSALIRSTVYKARVGINRYNAPESESPDESVPFKEDPLGFMAYLEQRILPRFIALPHDYGSWWSTFQHKLIFFLAVLYSIVIESEPTPEMKENLDWVRSSMRKFLQEVVAVTHPEQAELFIQGLLEEGGALQKAIDLDWNKGGKVDKS